MPSTPDECLAEAGDRAEAPEALDDHLGHRGLCVRRCGRRSRSGLRGLGLLGSGGGRFRRGFGSRGGGLLGFGGGGLSGDLGCRRLSRGSCVGVRGGLHLRERGVELGQAGGEDLGIR